MQVAARTGAWSGNELPYLRRVAYLESHGTEYIDTGIIATSKEFEVMNELNKAATDDEREVWRTLLDSLPVPN